MNISRCKCDGNTYRFQWQENVNCTHIRVSCGKCEKWLGWATQVEPIISMANIDIPHDGEAPRPRPPPQHDAIIKRAKMWLRHCEVYDDDASLVVRAACLVRDFGLAEDDAVDMMQWWSRYNRSRLVRVVKVATVHGAAREKA